MTDQQSYISVLSGISKYQLVDQPRLDLMFYGRFMEMQINLRRKKLHRTKEGLNFLEGSFSNLDNVRAPIQFRKER